MAEDSIKRLYVQNVDAWEKKLATGRFSDRELGIKVVEHAIILPGRKAEEVGYAGGVCDNDFNFVAGYTRRSNATNGNVGARDILVSYTVDRSEIVQLDEDVILGGVLRGHFGHFMVEGWCRLWYVLQHPELKLKIVFVHYRGVYHRWNDDFFRLMGIDTERIVYIKQPTQCRSIIIPDQSSYAPGMFMKEFSIPYSAIKEHVTPSEHKKIYLTRSKLKAGGHMHNEKYFEEFFAKRDFKIVSMEKLSIEEQISLIMGADEIASTMGTLTHWELFCKPTAKFIMFPRIHTKQSSVRFQFFINDVINLKNVYIVDVYKSIMYPQVHDGSECLIGSTKYWKEFVADYFCENIAEDDDSSYFGVALDKYINSWCQRYVAETDTSDYAILSLKNMCTRIIALEQEKIQSDHTHEKSLLESTQYWKTFVTNYFGEQIAEADDGLNLNEALDKYIGSWCQKYVAVKSKKNFSKVLNLFRSMCTRIVTLEREQIKHRPLLTYQTHVAKFGWSKWISENQVSNPINQKRDIQAVKINFPEHKVYYSVYYNETEGWSPEVSDGAQAGTTGLKKSIFGIKIRLDDSGAFDILYRVHTFDGVWTPWARNGAELLSQGVKLNSIQIKLETKT